MRQKHLSHKILDQLDRRELIARATGGAAAVFFGLPRGVNAAVAPTTLAGRDYLMAGFRERDVVDATRFRHFLAAHDLVTKATELVPVGFDVHSILQSPRDPHFIVAISKEQDSLTYFASIRQARGQSVVKAAEGNIFSGHGLFSADGSILVTSETDRATKTGDLCIRDGTTLKLLSKVSSGGVYPHEMKFVDGGAVLAVANGGYQFKDSNFTFVELKTGRVLETHVPPKAGPGLRHFALDEAGRFSVGTWSRYDGSTSKVDPMAEMMHGRRGEEKSLRIVQPNVAQTALFQAPASQYLSVMLHAPTNTAVMTASTANIVAVVDMATGSVRKILPKDNPAGVAMGPAPDLVVVSDGLGRLQFLDMKTLSWRAEMDQADAKLSGSHMSSVKLA